MDRKIKTRQVHKDIKVLDKTITVADHVKQSYVRINVKQSMEISEDRDNNPVEYAEDTVSEYAERIFRGTEHQIHRQAGKVYDRRKKQFTSRKNKSDWYSLQMWECRRSREQNLLSKELRLLNETKRQSRLGKHRSRL